MSEVIPIEENASTYTFTTQPELLPLHLGEDFQELLEETNELHSQIVFVL